MFLIKSKNITPKKKWQVKLVLPTYRKPKQYYYYYNVKTYRRKTLRGNIAIHGLRFFTKTFLFKIFINKIKLIPFVVTNYGFNKLPAKEFVWVKSLFNQNKLMFCSELSRPGSIFYPLSYILSKNTSVANQYLPLYLIPINTIIICVFNFFNKHITYAVSSGCFAKKRKNFKKTKLIFVELPSGTRKLFPTYTFCLLSPNLNNFINKTVLGGWGYTLKQKKKICVRGVAMNPVDHPNGGRTKAKQPELSPWGWIAKKNK